MLRGNKGNIGITNRFWAEAEIRPQSYFTQTMFFYEVAKVLRYLLADEALAEGQGWFRCQLAFVEFEALARLFRKLEEFFDRNPVGGVMTLSRPFWQLPADQAHIL